MCEEHLARSLAQSRHGIKNNSLISRRSYWRKMLLLDAQCSVRSRERRQSYLVNEVRLGDGGAPGRTWDYGTLVSEADFDSNLEYAAWTLDEVISLSLSFPSVTWEQ